MAKNKRLQKKQINSSYLDLDSYSIPSTIELDSDYANLINGKSKVFSFSDVVDENKLYRPTETYSSIHAGIDSDWHTRRRHTSFEKDWLVPVGSADSNTASIGKAASKSVRNSDDMYELAREHYLKKQHRPVSSDRSIIPRKRFTDDDIRKLADESNARKQARKLAQNIDDAPKTTKQFTTVAGRLTDEYELAKNVNAKKASRLSKQKLESMALTPYETKSKSLATIKKAAKTTTKESTEKAAKSFWQTAKDMKIPQIALGVGVTAWLVNKLSDSRGQQSNGQLYGGQGY